MKYQLNINLSITGGVAAYTLHYKKANEWHSSPVQFAYGYDKETVIPKAMEAAIEYFGATHIASISMFHDARTLNDNIRNNLKAIANDKCGCKFYPFITKDSAWQKQVSKHADSQWRALKEYAR